MELTLPIAEFELKLDAFISDGKIIMEKPISSEQDFVTWQMEVSDWERKTASFLMESFSGKDQNYFQKDFYSIGRILNLGVEIPFQQKAKNLRDSLLRKLSSLNQYKRLLSISDAIVDPLHVKEEKRKTWPIKRRKLFLLNVLHKLNDSQYYPLDYIFWANDLDDGTSDPKEIAKMLFDDGLIVLHNRLAKINAYGINYLEELNPENSSPNVTSSADDLNLINEKLSQLEKLANQITFGNEIIFEELQELKQAKGVLNLKNWKQLAKGKLFDLVQETADDGIKDTIKDMFNSLVDEGAKLLS